MTFIRKRLSYANVTVTLALVFAMSGGAYAAKHYLITNTKQISPKVLKQLKGMQGPAGPAGQTGVAGANGKDGAPGGEGKQGPEGKEGKAGANGAPGANGKSVTLAKEPEGANCEKGGSKVEVEGNAASKQYVCNGAEGPPGPQGSPWTAGGTLPLGKTETGSWVVREEQPEATTKFYVAPISFAIPLAAPLAGSNIEFVKKGATGTNCTGTPEAPTAPSGFLCVYAAGEPDVKAGFVVQSGQSGFAVGASTAGAFLALLVEAPVGQPQEGNNANGTWAVTG